MIIVRIPLRISFAGGGSDQADFYKQEPGLVISSTIDKYIWVTVNDNFADKVHLRYSEKECVDHREDLKHTIVKECMRMTGIERGIEIVIVSDVPTKGTGLGSSSALTVGLLQALFLYKGKKIDNHKLAEMACEVEIDRLRSPIGKQDQFSVALGGCNSFEFMSDGWVKTDNMYSEVNPKIMEWFEKSLMLFYVGGKEANGILCNRRKDEVGHQLTRAMKYLARDMISCLKDGIMDLRLIGDILNTGYIYKMESGNGAVSAEFEAYYKLAIESGAIGGKPTGASGGFMLLAVEENNQDDVRKAIDGLKEVPFKFEKEGSKVVYG